MTNVTTLKKTMKVQKYGAKEGVMVSLDLSMFPKGELPQTKKEQVFWATPMEGFVKAEIVCDRLPHICKTTVGGSLGDFKNRGFVKATSTHIMGIKEYKRVRKTYTSKWGKAKSKKIPLRPVQPVTVEVTPPKVKQDADVASVIISMKEVQEYRDFKRELGALLARYNHLNIT